MTLTFDLFWSFRSPYSYLATGRICEIARDFDVEVNVRPVYPIAVRIPGFFKTVNPQWPPYLMKDTVRVAEMNNIPYKWPNPDPVQMDLSTGEVPKDQPHIYRLTRAGAAACEAGHGLSFIDKISQAIWTGTDNWHEGDHLRNAARSAGVDLDEIDRKIETDPDHFEAIIRKNEEDQKAAGHWGVPLMVFEGEPFFGQDRLGQLVWRMKQHGLKATQND